MNRVDFAAVSGCGEPRLLAEPRKLPFSDGFKWFRDALGLFARHKWLWFAMGLTDLLFVLLLQEISDWLYGLLSLFFAGGIALAADAQEQGGELRFAYLFSGFRYKFVPLLKLTALYFVMMLLATLFAGLLLFVFGGIDGLGAVVGNEEVLVQLDGAQMAVMGCLIVLVLLPALMAVWLAPALICLHDIPVVQAVKMSFGALMRNIKPVAAYVFGWLVLLVLCWLLIAVSAAGVVTLLGTSHAVFGAAILVLTGVGAVFNAVLMLGCYTAFCRIWQE